MKTNKTKAPVCPICGQTYSGYPALSRTDNKTRICPDCGTRQAIAATGAGPDAQEEILRRIHAHTAAG